MALAQLQETAMDSQNIENLNLIGFLSGERKKTALDFLLVLHPSHLKVFLRSLLHSEAEHLLNKHKLKAVTYS